jgi:hypothetical protein
MREKLNESKAAQIGLVALLAVVAAVMFLGKSGGGGSETEVEAAPEEGAALAVAAPTGMGELPTSLPAAKAPPHAFRAAYDSGEAVALLVVHDGGIDDAYTALALKEVATLERVAVFVVPAKRISRYASVTVGLDVNQLPALIVLRPKRLSHGVPQATVSYGYQSPESVYQTLRDASYVGPEQQAYHPG